MTRWADHIRVEVHDGDAAKHGAAIALDHHLYVSSEWQLRGRLLTVKAGDRRGVVAIAYKGDVPHAVVLLRIDRGYEDVAAYTLKMSRREGLASACVDAIRKAGYTFPTAATGIAGSEHFWRRNNVNCPENSWLLFD